MNNVGYVLDVEDNYEALVVRDEQGDDWIEFQRALRYDDQDRELGMDTYCLVRGGSAAYYGGLISWRLRYGILQLQLDADASATLEMQTAEQIDVGPIGAALIEQHLPRIVGY